MVRKVKEEKKKVLQEQLDLIHEEKNKVQDECDGLQYQVEVWDFNHFVFYVAKKV